MCSDDRATGFAVIDSTGRTVGELLGFHNLTNVAVVMMRLAGREFPFNIFRDGYLQPSGTLMVFDGLDCTGNAYRSGEERSISPTRVVDFDHVLWLGELGTAAAPLIQSQFREPFGCQNWDEFGWTEPRVIEGLFPIEPIADLDDHFTPPFTVVRVL